MVDEYKTLAEGAIAADPFPIFFLVPQDGCRDLSSRRDFDGHPDRSLQQFGLRREGKKVEVPAPPRTVEPLSGHAMDSWMHRKQGSGE